MVSRDDAFLSARPLRMVPDTVSVLAVMVQFQIDNDSRTSGNGQFDVSAPTEPIIDAPPRNKSYFEDHLTFLANYFRKVSKGMLFIRSKTLDSVFTLPAPMASYSPPKGGPDSAVANLARDTWLLVNSSGLVSDFSPFDCFVVFHAGVGRDVDLVSQLGFDPTPLDIPSLFIGLAGFRKFYGQDYPGIPVNGGFITNSIIMPETENRLIPSVGGNVLLELGINGLLCASLGSYLGLPDLFNTSNGRSGIGRFGLMDGQSIFSFAGAFPSEPSAWEKYWLGWIDPKVIPPGDTTITVPAVGLPEPALIYRIPISSREYFLVENRNRDPLRNGQKITSRYNGVPTEQLFARDTVGFNAFDIRALAGVVTDVEDFDWSLPGGVDANGSFFDGGILIWHIDETVIAASLVRNAVNANPQRRGIDLEEADGSQDIGEEYGFLSAGSGSEEGTPLDFWFQGNSAPVYRNEFSSTSFPNSLSNNFANSHVTISDFTTRSPRMTARVRIGDSDVSPLNGFPKSVGQSFAPHSLTVGSLGLGANPAILVSTTQNAVALPNVPGPLLSPGKLYAWYFDGSAALPGGFANGLIATAPAANPPPGFAAGPALADLSGDGITEIIVGQSSTTPNLGILSAYTSRDVTPADSLSDVYFSSPLNGILTTTAVIADSVLALGDAQGDVYFIRFNGTIIDSVRSNSDSVSQVAGISRFVGANTFIVTSADGNVGIISRSPVGGATSQDMVRNFRKAIVGPAVTGSFGAAGANIRIAFATRDGYLYVVDPVLNPLTGFPINTGSEITEPPSLADVDGDGSRDIVIFGGNTIFAYNMAGASLDYFPITIPSTRPLASAPVIADLNGDGDVEIIGATDDGLVVAYDKRGRLAPGFPLQGGAGRQSVGVFTFDFGALSAEGIGLAVASSDDGSVSAWRTGFVRTPGPSPNLPWPQYQKDAQHSGLDVTPLQGAPLSTDFFPADRAYNWPNPVYDGKTFIRYFVREDAIVRVKIFDLAGDLVKELSAAGVGGVDNEIEWNVAEVQSGIYFARIEASGAGGSGVTVVKVAVVK